VLGNEVRVQDGQEEAIRRTRQLEELRLDISEVDAYAREVDDEFGGSWQVQEADPIRLVLAVTTDPAPHRDALRTRLEHADRLDVVQVRYPHAELREVHRVIDAERGRGVVSVAIDPATNAVVVTLSAANAAYADELGLRYGDRVRIALELTDSPAARPEERRDARER
jgi:hypothetical protein